MMRAQFDKLLSRLRSGSFLGNVLILAGGTGIAQLLVVLVTPILTRIYSPDDFGVLTVFISILGLLIVVSALRYEVAIPLPASASFAINLTALSGAILLGMTAVLGVLVFLFGAELAEMLSVPQLTPYLWLIPLGMFTGGGFQVLSFWHIRQRRFNRLTQAKISQSASMVGGQLAMGWMQIGAVGLVGGYVLGRIVAVVFLLHAMWRQSRDLFAQISLTNIRKAASRYRRFPLISSWSALLNQGGLQAAPLLFAAFFGAQVAGWFGLAQRVAGIPLTLIGRSVSQVNLGEASRLRNENPVALRRLFLRTASKLFLYVGVPLLGAGLISPWVFGFIFGDQWRTSGWYIVALLPMFLGRWWSHLCLRP
jgi:O-antigen/teichoic acid export membrane protein